MDLPGEDMSRTLAWIGDVRKRNGGHIMLPGSRVLIQMMLYQSGINGDVLATGDRMT